MSAAPAAALHPSSLTPHPSFPPILSLLDRPTLRFLAAWSPAVAGVAHPTQSLSPVEGPSAVSAVPAPRTPHPAPPPSVSAVPEPRTPSPEPRPSVPAPRAPSPEPPPFNLPLLCARSGLTEKQALQAFELVRAHHLIHPDGGLDPHVRDLLDTRAHRLTAFARRRRLLVNRANALKSTGPRTPQGKSIAAINGLTHGLTAQLPLLPTENELHYLALQQALVDEYQPVGPTEILLADQLAHLAWRLRRAHLAEAELTRHTRDLEASPGDAILRACEDHVLPKLDRHLTAIQRAFNHCLHELQEIQGARRNAESNNEMEQVGFGLKNDEIIPDPAPDPAVDCSLLTLLPPVPPAPPPAGALADILSTPPSVPPPSVSVSSGVAQPPQSLSPVEGPPAVSVSGVTQPTQSLSPVEVPPAVPSGMAVPV